MHRSHRFVRSVALAAALALGSLGVAPAPAFAEDAPAADAAGDVGAVLKRIQTKYEAVDVVQARFAQKSTSPLYGESDQTGSLTVQRPKKMRWDFEGDGKQFISDGTTMWVYSKNDNQVIRYTDFGSQSASADAILQSLDKLGELFDVELGLTPKDEASKAQVKSIRLALTDELELREVAVTDAYDGVTTLRFETVTLGGSVAPDTFQFKVPEGAEVVDVSG
jgi:outer membrane lipoprotein carrier protein